ncbi:hypothetical protein GCM10023191_095700 [Actinoallomurus oryzae]|uniref:Uncharacterized protein n=1 Tax=Actinoallomurus oryzae TaxID=502180 RepID=A0ABP8R6Z8_9ACTN
MWRQLLELSAGYAQAAATVDRRLLLRDLGTRIGRGAAGGREAEPAAVLVAEADPRRLGVHASIRVDGGDLPSYVPRDVDDGEKGVRALVTKAAGQGGFVLLAGGSSAGKTRCAYEAVRAVCPDWYLVHPSGPAEAAGPAARPPRRTVVWLDEIQRYLGEQGLTGAVVRGLLDAPSPVVIIGTIRADSYLEFTRPPAAGGSDRHAHERDVLGLAEVVHVGDEFSAAERSRAEAVAGTDLLLATALYTDGHGVTQNLVAAPRLVRQWEIARAAHPYAWAILSAAVDLRTLGAESPLPEALLRDAAPGYCTERQRAEAPADWFERGLAYATRELGGAAAALSPVGGPEMGHTAGYKIADYLWENVGPTRGARRVPAGVWDAALAHLENPGDVFRVARSASARMLYRYAIPLYRRAADAGDLRAAEAWAVHTGDPAGLARLRARVDTEEAPFDDFRRAAGPASDLAEAFIRLGRPDRLRALHRRAAGSGHGWELGERFAQMLADRGAVDELRALADRGDDSAARWLANLLARRRDPGELRARARIETGVVHPVAASYGRQTAARERLTEYLIRRGELGEVARRADGLAAARLFKVLRARGDVPGMRRLCDEHGGRFAEELAEVLAHRDDGEGLLSLAANASGSFLLGLAMVLRDRGVIDELRAFSAYDENGPGWLPDILADRGESAALAEYAAESVWGVFALSTVLGCRGDLAGLRALADGDIDELGEPRLHDFLLHRGAFDELESRARAGDTTAARRLAYAFADRGDVDRALRLLRDHGDTYDARITREDLAVDLDRLTAEADDGDDEAAGRLATALVRRGEFDRLRDRADGGDETASRHLADALVDRDELDGLRSLADGGHRYAAERLADVLVHRGRTDELAARADDGDPVAARRLFECLVNRRDLDALRRRAEAGDAMAGERLSRMAAARGDIDRLRAEAGRDLRAAERLAKVLADRGEIDELEALVDGGGYLLRDRLAGLLADRGEIDRLRARATAGDPYAQEVLAEVLADRGDIDELRARVARDPGEHLAAQCLAELLVQRERLAEAQRILLEQVSLGNRRAAQWLPELLVRRGRHEEARRLARYGLDTDGSIAAPPEAR